MKQHITLEQLNDLIYSDFEAFKELFRTLYSDVEKNEDVWQDEKDIHCGTLYVSKGVVTHHLNIGKMIEILDSICYFNIYKDFETEK